MLCHFTQVSEEFLAIESCAWMRSYIETHYTKYVTSSDLVRA